MAKSGPNDVSSEGNGEKKVEAATETKESRDGNKNDDAEAVISAPLKTTTPISICIESLVKSLCNIYEPDDEKAKVIYNLICKKLFEMKLIDESYSMNEFEGMRNQYQRALYHLVTSARGGEQPVPVQPVWPSNDITNEWSHYYREFDEIEYIAGGGFGQVYRVKHKLDGTEYAIKKIFIRSEGIKSVMNYLSEVKTFASLNHSNIVQYKAAWLELGGAPVNQNAIADSTDTYYPFLENDSLMKMDNGVKIQEHIDDLIHGLSEVDTILPGKVKDQDSSDFEISFEESAKLHPYSFNNNESSAAKRRNGFKRSREKRNSISEGGNAICKVEEIRDLIHARHNHQWATLYIQMALCQATLKQWLEKRNEAEILLMENDSTLMPLKSSHDTVMEILKQLLRGIEYIHSKNMVHHDIKPSNIFIQCENGQLLVQLGDFGLACPLQSARHSLAFGTKLYAAPEQLLGKCDPKSDMYSLGIVLLELIERFNTDMERVQTITELRKGHLPDHISTQHPEIASIIRQLVRRYPQERPDAAYLLKSIHGQEGESEIVQELKGKLAEKELEVLKLREKLKSLGIDNI